MAFKPGQSGNPSGRPKGARNKTTLAVEKLLDGEAKTITKKCIEFAKKGDITCMRIVLDRVAPVRKDRHVTFAFPKLAKSEDAVRATAALVDAVSRGALTPSEAESMAKIVDGFSRNVHFAEIEARLERLERSAAK